MVDSVKLALSVATAAHRHQKRKYTGEPYIYHCQEVVSILMTIGAINDMLAAGWLHDVLEDAPITAHDLSNHFSEEIVRLVVELTDVSRPSDGNRAKRKAKDRDALAKASNDAKTIKCADVISNTSSIRDHDSKFATVYLEEKQLLMPVLVGADQRLWYATHALAHRAGSGHPALHWRHGVL